MSIATWLIDHMPFLSAIAHPAVATVEARPAMAKWIETAIIGIASAFVALQINSAVQNEKISGQALRLARIEVKLDGITDALALSQLNAERILGLQKQIDLLHREVAEKIPQHKRE